MKKVRSAAFAVDRAEPLLLLAYQTKETHEDVDEVEVNSDCAVDRIVDGVSQSHCPVEVKDDQRAEDE